MLLGLRYYIYSYWPNIRKNTYILALVTQKGPPNYPLKLLYRADAASRV